MSSVGVNKSNEDFYNEYCDTISKLWYCKPNEYTYAHIPFKSSATLFGYHSLKYKLDIFHAQYALLNLKKDTETDYFLDAIYPSYCESETWTGKYICGRIGKKFYIVDFDGNCFWESDKPYIICENVIIADSTHIINKKFKKVEIDYGSELYVVQRYEHAYAFRKDIDGTFVLLDTMGNTDVSIGRSLRKYFGSRVVRRRCIRK